MCGARRALINAFFWTRRMCFQAEALIIRCSRRHRLKIVTIIHPISAAALISVIGFVYVYDLCYVGSQILGTNGWWCGFNYLLANFIFLNVLGNWWLSFRTDNSVNTLPAERRVPDRSEAPLWHYCIACDRLVPPRSWHCRLCKGCMLKRDHHCTISGNCIGHNNQRYFICFLFYLAFGCGMALVYNFIFARKTGAFLATDPILLLGKIAEYSEDPLLTWKYTVATIFKLNLFLFVVALVMFGVQIVMIHRNSTCYMIFDWSHDQGWRRNFKGVLGRRMFWTFLWPTIKSPLPQDGTKWRVSQHV